MSKVVMYNCVIAIVLACGLVGCQKETPQLEDTTDEAAAQPAVATSEPAAACPLHATTAPAMDLATMPAGHPPTSGDGHGMMGMGAHKPQPNDLKFAAPEGWAAQPVRSMTKAVYTVPKVAGDTEDADLAVSFFAGMKQVPLELNVKRWAGQFTPPDTMPSTKGVKQTKLEGTKYPTTIVDIAGQYHGGGMLGTKEGPKDNYRMLAAEIRTEDGPWFVKLVGPAKTVAHWEKAFIKFVSEAK